MNDNSQRGDFLYNFTWDLNVKRELEAEYGNRPILVAETIYHPS